MMIELELEPGEPEKPIIQNDLIYIPKVRGSINSITIDKQIFYNMNDTESYDVVNDYNDELLILNFGNFLSKPQFEINIENTSEEHWIYDVVKETTRFYSRQQMHGSSIGTGFTTGNIYAWTGVPNPATTTLNIEDATWTNGNISDFNFTIVPNEEMTVTFGAANTGAEITQNPTATLAHDPTWDNIDSTPAIDIMNAIDAMIDEIAGGIISDDYPLL
jgi:hypothetical protein